ncbi:hypothetical protein SGFS_086850 [Streptomyces graminofaciens]|uniref:Uncharacterized protein n=1 Tax=Streptomyces graminofaciens TaxID=68212 RepID=A0ABM8HJT1_9ACTN|nr:hypothetical protein SGFS_086850 [Streptomyces graminofaciens]
MRGPSAQGFKIIPLPLWRVPRSHPAYFAEGLGGDLDRLVLALKRHQTAAAKAIGEVVTARARNLKYACQ